MERSAHRRNRPGVRRLAIVSVTTFAMIALALGVALGPVGERWVKNTIVEAGDTAMASATLSVDEVRLGWGPTASIRGVSILDDGGHERLSLEALDIRLRPIASLFRGELVLETLTLDALRLAVAGEEGQMVPFSDLFTTSSTPVDEVSTPFEFPLPLAVERVNVDGVVLLGHTGGELADEVRLALGGSFQGGGSTVSVSDVSLDLQGDGPRPIHAEIEGSAGYENGDVTLNNVHAEGLGVSVVVDGSVDHSSVSLGLDLRADDLSTLGEVLGMPELLHGVSGRVDVAGAPERWSMTGAIDSVGSARGRLEISGSGDGADWEMRGDVQTVHAADWLPSIGPDDPVLLDGEFVVKGAGLPSSQTAYDVVYSGRPGQRVMGTTLGAADIAIRYADGQVTVQPTTVDGWLGVLQATGEFEVGGGPLAIEVQGSVHPERLAALGVPGVRGVGRLWATLRGDPTGDTGPLSFEGTLSYPDVGWGADVDVRALALRVEGSVNGDEASGWLTLETGSGVLYGLEVAESRTFRATWHRDAQGQVVLVGRTGLTQLAQDDTVQIPRVTVDWNATVADSGAISVRSRGTLEEVQIASFPLGSGPFSASMRGDALAVDLSLNGPGGVGLAMDGTYDLGSGQANIERLRLAPTSRASWSGQALRGTLTRGGVEDVFVDVDGALGSVHVEGHWPAEGVLDGRVALEDVQLDLLTEWGLSGDQDISGALGVEVLFSGTRDRPEMVATLDVGDVWLGSSVRDVDVGGTITARGSAAHIDLQALAGDRRLAVLNGVVPVSWRTDIPELDRAGSVRLKTVLAPGSFEHWARHFPSAMSGLPSGEASAVLDVQGRWKNPDIRISGVVESVVPGWTERARMEWQAERLGERLTLWADVREGLTRRLHVEAKATTGLEEVFASVLGGESVDVDIGDWDILAKGMNIQMDVEDVPAQSLGRLMGAPGDLGGAIDGRLTVTGSPYYPVVGGRLGWSNGRIGEVALGPTSWEMFPTGGGYLVDLSMGFENLSTWAVAGRVPFQFNLKESADRWLDGSFDLTVDGALPLALWSFADPKMQGFAGEVAMSGVIEGPAQRPVPRLTARCEGGAWSALDYGLRFDDLTFALDVSESAITLETLRVVPSALRATPSVELPGSVEARGSLMLDRGIPGALSGGMRFVDAPTVSATPGLRLRVEGDLSVGGRWDAVELDGNIAVKQGRVQVDAASFLEVGEVAIDPSIAIDRGSASATRRETTELEVAAIDVSANLRLDLGRNVELALAMPFLDDYGAFGSLVGQLDLSARLGGALDVVYDTQGLELGGTVDILDGVVGILRSRFELNESAIAFSGADYTNPILDIAAQMDTGQDVIELQVGGTPTVPEIQFKSDTLVDENQILMTLLTGRSPSDIDATEGEGALQALAGVLFNRLLAGAGSFSIEPDGTVRAGLPITSDLYATTLLQPSPGPNESPFTVVLDWSLSPHLVSSTGLGIPRVWTNLFWELRF